MTVFATEFPLVSDFGREAFSKMAFDWLMGVRNSSLKNNLQDFEEHQDEIKLIGENGESFQLKWVDSSDWKGAGFRYEKPDGKGLTFKTECVHSISERGNFIRIKVQCLTNSLVTPITPKKPVLVRQLINQGFAADDGFLSIKQKPHLPSAKDGQFIDLISDHLNGNAKQHLPLVFVTRCTNNGLWVDPDRLAWELSGVAHVVVEPQSSVSFTGNLRKKTDGGNPYAGTIGVSLPRIGLVRKFFKRGEEDTKNKIEASIVEWVIAHQSIQTAVIGEEWVKVEELHVKKLRDALRQNSTSSVAKELSEYVLAFDEEISVKDERISELEKRVKELTSFEAIANKPENAFVSEGLVELLAPELYLGEINDRLRDVVKKYLVRCSDEIGSRERAVLEKLINATQPSGRSIGLVNELKNAGKSNDSMAAEFYDVLKKFGYQKKSENKHYKLEAADATLGLKTEIFPKTPSDFRAGRNRASDIIRNLGLAGLHKS